MTNARKHSHGTRVILAGAETDEGVRITVEDNGRGLDHSTDAESSGHWGVIGMHERAREIGATLTVDSRSSGTIVTLTLPHAVSRRTSGAGA